MKDILSEIIAHKRIELAEQMQMVPLEMLREQAMNLTMSPCSMKQALAQSTSGIIAEFKRRSPSKGWIKQDADASAIPASYAAAGASALSILTDDRYFGGRLRDIRQARPLVSIPILRKEFIIHEYQLLQAKIVGANAILLIASCLTKEECSALTHQAHLLGLEVLLEIHSEEELGYVLPETDMVGVNNRHLGTFVTEVSTSFQLADRLQAHIRELQKTHPSMEMPVLVSESGLSDPGTVRELRAAGFRGFLMGEAFMKTSSPAETLHRFVQAVNSPDK